MHALLIVTLLLNIITFTSAEALKVFQWHIASGRITSDFQNEIPTVPGYAVFSVADDFQWSPPPPGVGYTSCATGYYAWNRLVAGVSSRKELLATGKEIAATLSEADDDELLPHIFRITERCPPANVLPRCIAARDYRAVISNVALGTFITEMFTLIQARGW